jgi:hypothetical protein
MRVNSIEGMPPVRSMSQTADTHTTTPNRIPTGTPARRITLAVLHISYCWRSVEPCFMGSRSQRARPAPRPSR